MIKKLNRQLLNFESVLLRYAIIYVHMLTKYFENFFMRKRKRNCFFSLFSVFKNNFLFLRLKNLFGNSKVVENKNCFQNSIYEGN